MSKNDMIEIETRKLELETNKFELEQRRAKALSVSAFFPDTLKGDIASAVIVYDLAQRMNISVMEVAQSIYIIYGRPSFSTNFLVARLNQSGLIKGALKTIVSKDKQSAYCSAVDAETGEELIGMEVTMQMAKAEGWLDKKGSKWKTMPELMLRKRAQSFFIKEFYPQVMFGMQTTEEVADSEAIPVEVVSESAATDDINAALMQKPAAPKAKEPEVDANADRNAAPEHEEKPKAKRVPRYISKWYFELQKLGLKTKDTRKFVEYMDWMEKSEEYIADFFAQDKKEIERYVNAFYGIDTPNEPDYTEAEIEEEDPAVTFGAESPNESTASQEPTQTEQTHANSTQPQKAETGVSLARYKGALIGHGVKPEDVDEFMSWASLDESNIAGFMADKGAVDALVEQFNAETGYAG